jgi:glutathione S-transferase
MKLYTYEESGNSYKVRLLLALLDVTYETVVVDLLTDEQHSPGFLAINPRGEVPTLQTGDLVLRDSAAIMVYVAAEHGGGSWWPSDVREQAQIVEWLAFAASWVQYGVFTARALVAFGMPANGLPLGFPESLDGAQIRGVRSLEILNEHLLERQWLACARPTVADISVFPYVALAPMGDIDLEPYPQVLAWIDRIKALPGFISMPGLDDPKYRS